MQPGPPLRLAERAWAPTQLLIAGLVQLLMEDGWRDTFRVQHPDVHGYTYYGYRMNMRAKKKGWRLDYFLTSAQLEERCHDSFILPDFLGSDHCPIGLTLTSE